MHVLRIAALLVSALQGGPEALPPEATPEPAADAGLPTGPLPEISDAGQETDGGASDAPFTPSPAVDAPGMAVTADAERVVPQQDFVKGELSVFLGSDRLTVKRNRIGVSVGFNQIGKVYYALVDPQVDVRLLDRKLAIGIGVPLNFEVLNFNDDPNTGAPIFTSHAGTFRKEDWQQPSEYARVLNYVTYGRKEDNLYVNVGQVYAQSIGHGAIVRRYAPDIDPNLTRVSAQVDAYNDYAGFEALTNDVVQWNLLSALGFVKPLSWLSDNLLTKTLSVGGTIATDLTAPRALVTDANGVRQLDQYGRLQATTSAVVLGGVDAEVKVVKTPFVDIKPYVDYSRLFGGDGGYTLGGLGRFNVPSGSVVHAFRVVVEARYLQARYVPSYFDTFYEVERYQSSYSLGPQVHPGFINYLTKYQDVISGELGNRGGYYVEASYGIRNKVGVTLAIEGDTVHAQKNFIAHLEVPWVDFLQFFASYYRHGFVNFSELGNFNLNGQQDMILFGGARLRTFPFLFFNARVFKTFAVNPDVQRYDNVFGFMADVEIGWEFWTHDQEIQDRLKELQTAPASGQGDTPR
jgi:hypothetical protein